MSLRLSLLCTAFAAPALLLSQESFEIALIGDMPYGAALESAYERVIADINRYNPAFTAFIGDTKSGSTRCDESHYAQALGWFNTFETALIYSIGDNEWTDCLRANNGAYDPLGRLALIRRTFFPTSMSLGKRPIALQRQSDDPAFSLYRENSMLVQGPFVFSTVHIPGSNNNFEYKSAQGVTNPFYDGDKEYTARNAANLAWLSKTFETARAAGAFGIMILIQANMFESFLDTSTGSTHSGFAGFIALLRRETSNFDGEVVLVSGDSHYMRIDKPLTDTYPACASADGDCKPVDPSGKRIFNFTRVEVPGSNDVHWVRCHLRPNRRTPFRFEFMIVPENR